MQVSFTATTVCTATGFNITPSSRRSIFRVAQTRYGPINPPAHSAADDPENWSRWDTPGRTIYGCATPTGALVEVLEYIRPDPPAVLMAELFDDVSYDDELTLAEQIARELPAHGAMPYRSISRGWREARSLYELHLPHRGWFVNIAGAQSISTLTAQLGSTLLAECNIDQLTISELTSSAPNLRRLTTGIATWIRDHVILFDGQLPHGIVYPSKWGTSLGDNYAVWLRRTDDGTGSDDVDMIEASTLGRHTKPLVEAAALRGMKVF